MPVGLKRYAPKDTQIFAINDFTGGINYMLPPENIQLNEVAFMENFEYDSLSGMLKTVDGLSLAFNTGVAVSTLYYDANHGVFLFSSDRSLYKTDLTEKVLIGTLSGNNLPFFCPYDNVTIIVSGGVPQSYDGETLSNISAYEPDGTTPLLADIAFARSGRLILAKTGADYLLYSGIGLATNWNFNGNDADAQYVEIGYKDSTDIVAVVPLAQDIIVFKSDNKGTHKAFRVTGEYPSWEVHEVSRNADCANKYAAFQAFNDVYFIGRNSGFTSLATVQDYGAVKMLDVGAKINRQLTGIVDENCQIFYVPIRKQLWIVPDSSGDVYVYNFISQTFTKRRMVTRPTGVAVKDNGVYIARGTKILLIDTTVDTDDGSPIVAYLQTKKFVAADTFVIKKLDVVLSNKTNAKGTVTAGGVGLQFETGGAGDYVFSDTDDVVSDTDDVCLPTYATFLQRGNYRCRWFEVLLTVRSGSASLRRVGVVVAEVG